MGNECLLFAGDQPGGTTPDVREAPCLQMLAISLSISSVSLLAFGTFPAAPFARIPSTTTLVSRTAIFASAGNGNADPEFSERCLREQVDSLLSHSLVKTVFARRNARNGMLEAEYSYAARDDNLGDLESRAEELVEWCLKEEIYDLNIVWSSKFYADLPTPPFSGHSPGLWVDCCADFWEIAPTLGERAALQEAMDDLHEPQANLALLSPPSTLHPPLPPLPPLPFYPSTLLGVVSILVLGVVCILG